MSKALKKTRSKCWMSSSYMVENIYFAKQSIFAKLPHSYISGVQIYPLRLLSVIHTYRENHFSSSFDLSIWTNGKLLHLYTIFNLAFTQFSHSNFVCVFSQIIDGYQINHFPIYRLSKLEMKFDSISFCMMPKTLQIGQLTLPPTFFFPFLLHICVHWWGRVPSSIVVVMND